MAQMTMDCNKMLHAPKEMKTVLPHACQPPKGLSLVVLRNTVAGLLVSARQRSCLRRRRRGGGLLARLGLRRLLGLGRRLGLLHSLGLGGLLGGLGLGSGFGRHAGRAGGPAGAPREGGLKPSGQPSSWHFLPTIGLLRSSLSGLDNHVLAPSVFCNTPYMHGGAPLPTLCPPLDANSLMSVSSMMVTSIHFHGKGG